MSDFDLDKISDRIYKICEEKGWGKDWSKGGCYIHLEVSEFIESLRGKGEDHPADEAADVLFALFAVMANYRIKPSDVMKSLEQRIDKFEEGT